MINCTSSVLDFWLTLGQYGQQFEEEFAKYMRHYKRRGVTDIILSEAEKVSMRYIRYFIPKNGSFGRAKRYLVQKRKQMFGRK